MRKILTFTLIFTIIFSIALTFAACGNFANDILQEIIDHNGTDNGNNNDNGFNNNSNVDNNGNDTESNNTESNESTTSPVDSGVVPCDHNFDSWIIIKRATCLEGGAESRTCTACGMSETRNTAITEHNIVVDRGQQESCTETGLTEGSHCADCNKVIVKQEVVPVTAHVFSPLAGKAATCNEEGLTEGSECAMCGCILLAQNVIPKLQHNYGDWTVTKDMTCTDEGVSSRFCEYCNHEETKSIASTGSHNYDFKIMSCTTCGAAVEPSDGLVFKLSDDGMSYACCGKEKYKLNGYDVIIIPGEYNGKPVTRVTSGSAGSGWFNCKTLVLCEGIEILNISASITKIKEIYLPESINGLSSNTFCMAESLEYVYAPYSTWSVYGVYTQKYEDDIILSDPHEAAVTLTKLSSYKKLYRK